MAVVLSYACNGVCAPEVWAWTFGSIGGIEATANGGDFFAVATAAFTSAALAYVGAEYGLSGGEFTSIEALQFGALGGITSILQGGKFGHGFVAAGLGAAAGSIPGLEGAGFKAGFTRVLVGSVVGGTISEITGGKFANGAAYGAFASIVREGVRNHESRNERIVMGEIKKISAEQAETIYKEAIKAAESLGVDVNNIELRNSYVIADADGEYRGYNSLASAERNRVRLNGRWIGGYEENGNITITRTGIASSIIAGWLGGKLIDIYNYRYSVGFESTLFVIGHEVGHRRFGTSEATANSHGQNLVDKWRAEN